MRSRHKKDRPYQIKKTGIKDENIDRQILVLHKAMLDKLCAQPALLESVLLTLESRKEQGRLGHGAYLTWYCALEQLTTSPEKMYQALLEDSSRMRKLRRQTPLVGLLTEQERQQALMADALGQTSIQTLLG
ncbi:hypothetical protein [Bowmanella pacifica]|uniref:Uncharacterized protein n=1 Tax=Bowmanella pacifica TaxID=502051 RepID=A0A918DM38_9ALTE|nr:hypothetical protein [Bowmanella pacifica]GGO72503.1 hypothetical protein GCM10010982_30790 [Bowmanella pacifica]